MSQDSFADKIAASSLSHSSQQHPLASGDYCGICRLCSHFRRRRPTTDRFLPSPLHHSLSASIPSIQTPSLVGGPSSQRCSKSWDDSLDDLCEPLARLIVLSNIHHVTPIDELHIGEASPPGIPEFVAIAAASETVAVAAVIVVVGGGGGGGDAARERDESCNDLSGTNR